LVDTVIDLLRKEGKTVGAVAIDPSSPFSGGAFLGDRIRMQRHATDEGVFIRSLATRGYLGGLSRATYDIINIMDAMGKDVILVETVGVGQDEVDVAHLANTSVVVLVPGMGDEIQAMKAGIIEIGDIFVINKCEREGTGKMEEDLRLALEIAGARYDNWAPPILKTEAISGKGVAEVVSAVYRHREALLQGGCFDQKVKERMKTTFVKILEGRITEQVMERIEREHLWDRILADLVARHVDPYTMAEQIITSWSK